jgi:hypothetical protein
MIDMHVFGVPENRLILIGPRVVELNISLFSAELYTSKR